MTSPSILISGASIAGPTAASWLAAAGWDVTVLSGSLTRPGSAGRYPRTL